MRLAPSVYLHIILNQALPLLLSLSLSYSKAHGILSYHVTSQHNTSHRITNLRHITLQHITTHQTATYHKFLNYILNPSQSISKTHKHSNTPSHKTLHSNRRTNTQETQDVRASTPQEYSRTQSPYATADANADLTKPNQTKEACIANRIQYLGPLSFSLWIQRQVFFSLWIQWW
jgi:hypothetical protein